MEDAAAPIDLVEKDGQEVVEAAGRKRIRYLERALRKDVHVLVEEAVAAHPVTGEAGHVVGDLESRVTIDSRRFPPGRLAGHVVGHLVLEEDVGAAVAVPDHLVLLEAVSYTHLTLP